MPRRQRSRQKPARGKKLVGTLETLKANMKRKGAKPIPDGKSAAANER